jgi:hypothetical protein
MGGTFFRDFEDTRTTSYEPQVDPLGNLEIVKKGEESSTVYVGESKQTMIYVSPPWALEITETRNEDCDTRE